MFGREFESLRVHRKKGVFSIENAFFVYHISDCGLNIAFTDDLIVEIIDIFE